MSVILRRLLTALPAVALLLGLLAPTARAGVANAGIAGAPASNPLAGLPWGIYRNPSSDASYRAYEEATGRDRTLLARYAERPRVRWFGSWIPDGDAYRAAREYVENSTGGDPDVLSQLAVFRVEPWEGEACRRLPSTAQRASYVRWIRAFARGLGGARVALVLQPDLPFAACAPRHSRVALGLVAYAARVFSALPRTTVYIDAGSADWPTVPEVTGQLLAAGVRYTRGFALNATHYDSTTAELGFGRRVAALLARRGVRGRHFVVNTAANGHPFTYQQSPRVFEDVTPCRSRHPSGPCVTLGIPPTTAVAAPRWGLSARARSIARRLCDGYLWYGRPWLIRQAAPFSLSRALAVAASTPYP